MRKKRRMMDSSLVRRALLTLALLGGVLMAPAAARADMLISPLRIVFDDRDRYADVQLVNTGKMITTYRMQWQYFKMNDQGNYDIVSAPPEGQFDPGKSIVMTPRQITLQPGERQTVRLALRRPPDLPAGEYRAHLQFEVVSQIDPSPQAAAAPGQNEIAVGVQMHIGYSIPVIVRSGGYDAMAQIQGIELKREGPDNGLVLYTDIARSGVHGALGHLYAYFTPAAGGAERLVGEIQNANIFSEVSQRKLGVRLVDENLGSGKLRVRYEKEEKQAGKSPVFDEKTFPVSP